MRCRLESNEYCDEDFQIEFNDLNELKSLAKSLVAMVDYIEMCKEDGEEAPELIYRINNLKKPKYGKHK